MHNEKRGEVPFPLLGEGIVLRYRTIDLAELRSKYGAPPNQKPEYDERGQLVDHFWTILFNGTTFHDPVIMADLLRAGLKKQGTSEKIKSPDVDFDDLPWSFHEMQPFIDNALFLSRWGMTAEAHAAKLREAAQELGAGDPDASNPLQGLGTTSTISSESSGPDTPQA